MEGAIEPQESDFDCKADTGQGQGAENAAMATESPLLGILNNKFFDILLEYERKGLIDDTIPRDWCLDHIYLADDGRYYADTDLMAHARRVSMGITRDLIDCSFKTFEGYSMEHKEIGRTVHEWASQWTPRGFKHSLLLIGPTGTGKSHLAVSALKLMISHGLTPTFADYRKMLINLSVSKWDSDPVGDYADLDLLLIDDMGSQKASQAQGDKMATIIAMRNADLKPTIITTNDSFSVDKYGRLASGEKFLDSRLVSRMSQSYKFINTGKLFDWRVGH